MIKWTKPSGQVVETNDLPATIKTALDLGWVRDNGDSGASGESKPAKNTGTKRRGTTRS